MIRPPRRGTQRRRGPSRLIAALATATALAAGLTGCSFDELQFTNDSRLNFDTPSARAEVEVPLTISWTMGDFEATGLDGSTEVDSGAFVVFLDQAPMPVGEDLRWVARDDTDCLRSQRCPTRAYLAEKGIFVTQKPSMKVTTLPVVADGVGNEQHYVNVVLVDGEGVRRRESAWFLPFETSRRAL